MRKSIDALCNSGIGSRAFPQKILFMMQLTVFLIICLSIPVQAEVRAQTVTLHKPNISIKELLAEIKRQTHVHVIYEDGLLDGRKNVNVHAKNTPLNVLLDKLLLPEGLSYQVYEGTLAISGKAINNKVTKANTVHAQQMLQGTVRNEKNQGLSGVTVRVVGKIQAATTDNNGNFSIQALVGDSLNFSYLGYAPQTLLATAAAMSVTLSIDEKNQLEEIVVVGLGNVQRKISVVAAISTITTKELTQSPVANLSNALAGRLPGLITQQGSNNPGAGSNMYIRGISTMSGSTAPMIIVDGLPRSMGDFSQLDPNEIESVSILKDASSTSLYGIQGANGVVVVTTKRGVADRRPEVNFTGQYATQSPIRMPQFMTNEQLALYDNEVFNTTMWTDEELEIIRNGSDPYLYPYVNWFDYLLKDNAPQQNYNINFRGGSTFAKYFVSGSYLNQGGLFDHDDVNPYGVQNQFKRYNFRSNIDLQVNKRLLLQVDVAGRLENRVGSGRGIDNLLFTVNAMNPNVTAVFNPDGSIAHGGKFFMPAGRFNPYALLTQSGYYTNYFNAINGTFLAKHELDFILPGLSVQGLLTFQSNASRNTSRTQSVDSFWYRGLDADAAPIYDRVMTRTNLNTEGNGEVDRRNYFDLRLNYNKRFGQHDVTAQVLGNRTLRIIQDQLPYAYQGISSRFTYGYADRYFAEVNMGYNGSENFHPDRRYGFFPSFSLGWVLTNESFFKDNHVLTFLKIRGSIGWVGNDLIGNVGENRWLYISDFAPGGGYSFGPTTGQNGGGYNENRVGNLNVTWERSQKANIGFDATFAGNVFNLTLDYFRENRSNILLAPGTVPDYVGVSGLAPRNTGEVLNQGFDGMLAFNKKIREFALFGNIQATYARNRIVANDQPAPAFPYQNLVGQEIGYTLGYRSLGIFTSVEEIQNSPRQGFASATLPGDIKYADINGDGVIDVGDRVPVQNQNVPRYVFGFSLGGSYKRFDASLLLNGATGSTTNMQAANFDFYLRGRSIWTERWNETTNSDANALLPSARRSTNNMQFSDFWLMKTDYLKLRNAEVGYTFPSRLVQRLGLQTGRIFVNGQNLLIWDTMWVKEQDPESTQNLSYYPQQRVFNFGISLTL